MRRASPNISVYNKYKWVNFIQKLKTIGIIKVDHKKTQHNLEYVKLKFLTKK
jgi:hypothetical protein